MKRLLIFLTIIVMMTACNMGDKMDNTPKKQVEAYLDSYQKLDDNVLNDLDSLVEDTEYNESQKMRYKELMKKHYSNLKYDIKGETIDGDKALVDVEIEVNDDNDILKEEINQDDYKDENGKLDLSKYFDYQLNKIEQATKKTKYTITFHLTKKDDKWTIEDLDKTSVKKIHGIYVSN